MELWEKHAYGMRGSPMENAIVAKAARQIGMVAKSKMPVSRQGSELMLFIRAWPKACHWED